MKIMSYQKLVLCVLCFISVERVQAQESAALNSLIIASEISNTAGDFATLGVRTANAVQQISYLRRHFENLEQRKKDLNDLLETPPYKAYVNIYGGNETVLNQIKSTGFLSASVAYLISDILTTTASIGLLIIKEGNIRAHELTFLSAATIKQVATEGANNVPIVGTNDFGTIVTAISLLRSNEKVEAVKKKVTNVVVQIEAITKAINRIVSSIATTQAIIESRIGIGASFLALVPTEQSSDEDYLENSYEGREERIKKRIERIKLIDDLRKKHLKDEKNEGIVFKLTLPMKGFID